MICWKVVKQLDVPVFYSNLPHDLAGSRSKNRFRVELLWGVCKMLDLMESSGDFVIVFDYVCDIEVHLKNGLEFYQIKTHGNNSPAYTYRSLSKNETKDSEGSIIGKLYVLNLGGSKFVKLAVVSNVAYNSNGKKIDSEIMCFDKLPDTEKAKLKDAIKAELNIEDVDFSGLYYLHTDINLRNPEQEVQGKIVISFEKIKQCEPMNPRALYRLIYDTVSERACYEFTENDYDALIRKKGITRDEFDRMLECHAVNEKTGIKQTQEHISSLKNIVAKRNYKKALVKLLRIMPTSRPLKDLEDDIAKFLMRQSDIGDMDAAIDLLINQFHGRFSIEYDNAEKTVFYMVILFKFQEGVYDDENDI